MTTRRKIIMALRSRGPMTGHQVAAEIEHHYPTVANCLSLMVLDGSVAEDTSVSRRGRTYAAAKPMPASDLATIRDLIEAFGEHEVIKAVRAEARLLEKSGAR